MESQIDGSFGRVGLDVTEKGRKDIYGGLAVNRFKIATFTGNTKATGLGNSLRILYCQLRFASEPDLEVSISIGIATLI